ncbi:hypothetical protein BTVI_75141 [Pitangus sulphuratus]|nr:hypothetical protein BTVI_75141 [Pitangus sulphuratus]
MLRWKTRLESSLAQSPPEVVASKNAGLLALWAKLSKGLGHSVQWNRDREKVPSKTFEKEILSCLHNTLKNLDLIYKSDHYSMTHRTGVNAI